MLVGSKQMKMFPLNILIMIGFSLNYHYSNAIYSCKSQTTGQDVDWFVVYKLPKLPEHQNPLIAEGKAYLYADGRSNEWTLPEHGIENPESAIGRTIEQDSGEHEEELFFTYNDQCPGEHYNFQRGHMKGMVLFDHYRGFWLIHSVPDFPILDRGGYVYPRRGFMNGQSFLCISMSTNTFVQRIAPLLHFSQANCCSGNELEELPHWIEHNAHVRAILQRQSYRLASWENPFRRQPFTSINGHAFEAFFKYIGHNNRDLYSHVGNALEITDFMVQSYIVVNNSSPMDVECPNCSRRLQCPYRVHNITKICLNLPNIRVEFVTFYPQGRNNPMDHSKWAVSRGGAPWVCIGDLNRHLSQLRRGGGAVCFQNGVIANLFRQAVCGVQEWCSSRH